MSSVQENEAEIVPPTPMRNSYMYSPQANCNQLSSGQNEHLLPIFREFTVLLFETANLLLVEVGEVLSASSPQVELVSQSDGRVPPPRQGLVARALLRGVHGEGAGGHAHCKWRGNKVMMHL